MVQARDRPYRRSLPPLQICLRPLSGRSAGIGDSGTRKAHPIILLSNLRYVFRQSILPYATFSVNPCFAGLSRARSDRLAGSETDGPSVMLVEVAPYLSYVPLKAVAAIQPPRAVGVGPGEP